VESEIILQCVDISKVFGGIRALTNVNMDVYKGEILGLIGPNGAGKTTLFNIIAGYYKPTSGDIIFDEEYVTGMSPEQSVKNGIARTFQLVQVFPSLTVLENVLLGALYGTEIPISYEEGIQNSFDALVFIGMSDFAYRKVNTLVLTERKKIELARALVTKPKLLLLDEMVAGLNPHEIDEILDIVRLINKELEITIIIVEHVMKVVMNISDRIVVLNIGEKIAEGAPKDIVKTKVVIDAYLGGSV